jgi:hypothetical protein
MKLRGTTNDDARRRLEAVDATFFDSYMVRSGRLVIDLTMRRHRANGNKGLVPWPAQRDKTRFDLRSLRRDGFTTGPWFNHCVRERRRGTLDPTVVAMLDEVDETWWCDSVTRTIASLEKHWDTSRNAVPATEGSTPYGPAERGLVLSGKWIVNRRTGVRNLLGILTGGVGSHKISWGQLRRLLRVMPTFVDTRDSARTFGPEGFVPFLKERLGLERDASAAELDAALARKAAAEDEKEGDDTIDDTTTAAAAKGVGTKRKREED